MRDYLPPTPKSSIRHLARELQCFIYDSHILVLFPLGLTSQVHEILYKIAELINMEISCRQKDTKARMDDGCFESTRCECNIIATRTSIMAHMNSGFPLFRTDKIP